MGNNRKIPEEPGTPKREPLQDQFFKPETVKEKNPLLNAVINYNVDEVKELLAQKADPNTKRDSDGSTPLHIAAESGHLFILLYLINAKADPNASRNDGKTPINLAEKFENVKVALDEAKEDFLKNSPRK